jgi:hypothetical protein
LETLHDAVFSLRHRRVIDRRLGIERQRFGMVRSVRRHGNAIYRGAIILGMALSVARG